MTTDRPVCIYSMTPRQPTAYKRFFESSELRSILERPGQLRPAGWDLMTHDQARIVKGDYLELKNAERKRIQVYEDGSIFVRVPADQEFLGWGQNEKAFDLTPRLNTLALIEFSFNFCSLCSQLITLTEPEPSEVELIAEIRNAFFLDNAKLFLIPHPVSTNWWTFTDDRYYAQEAAAKRRLLVSTQQLKTRPEVVAYSFVGQIFVWFGARPDEIPYSNAEGDLKFIDAKKIFSARGT